MKIIVVGAGGVGKHLARTLSWEGHEVILIDHLQELVDRALSSMDVLAIRGSGTSVSTLINAGARDTDLLVAVTSVDEVNIVACMLARQLGIKRRIARVRNQEYSRPDTPVSLAELGIDQVIHPELEAAREVVRLVKYQHATEVVECAAGKMLLIGLKVEPGSPILQIPLRELSVRYPDIPFRLVAIARAGSTILPSGKDMIKADDKVFVITKPEDTDHVFHLAGKPKEISRDIMILGGGMIGRIAAEQLETDRRFSLKLIESDPGQAQRAIQRLQNTMVVRASTSADFDVLAMEGLDEMGVFAALTSDDENNIVTSLFARHLQVRRTITLIGKPEYMPIVRAIGLDATINVKIITSDAVLKYMLGGRILAVSSLAGVEAEIIDLAVSEQSKVAGRTIRDIEFPAGAIVGAIEHEGEVTVAVGDSVVCPGDRLVVFCEQKAVPKLEKLFG